MLLRRFLGKLYLKFEQILMGVQDPSADINILSFDGIKESAG
jgi:hypothetical protein